MADKSLILTHVVKVEWGGEVGDKFYGDYARTIDSASIESRVTRWGEARSVLSGPGHGLSGSGTWGFTLQDADGDIQDAVAAVGLGFHKATLYLIVWDVSAEEPDWLGQADWIVVWRGITEERPGWRESDGTYSVSCLDYGYSLTDAGITEPIDSLRWPRAAPQQFGMSLPTIYGASRMVEGVCVEGGGPRTITTTQCDPDDEYVYVQDPTHSYFADSDVDNQIYVFIGRDFVKGYFDTPANKFVITNREISFHSGYLSYADADTYKHVDLDTTEASGYWEGFCIRMKVATGYMTGTAIVFKGPYQYRQIEAYQKNNGTGEAWLSGPFRDDPIPEVGEVWTGLWNSWKPPEGEWESNHPFHIMTARETHPRGEEFRYMGSTAVPTARYIVADRGTGSIYAVYVRTEDDLQELLPSGLYDADADDDRYLDELGRNCATVSFRIPPEWIRWGTSIWSEARQSPSVRSVTPMSTEVLAWSYYRGEGIETANRKEGSSEILVSVGGPLEEGVLIEHPARVIRDIAVRAGLDEADVDEDSIARAEQERDGWKCAFDLREAGGRVNEILAQIALHSGLALDWTQGKLRIVVLENAIDATNYGLPDMTIPSTGHFLDTLDRSFPGIQGAVTRIRGKFMDNTGGVWEMVLQDEESAQACGVHETTMDFWSFANEAPVRASASFWLYRMRYAPEVIRVELGLEYLSVLLGDVVVVQGRRGWVGEITYLPGGVDTGPRVRYAIATPQDRWYDDTWEYANAGYSELPQGNEPGDEENESYTGSDLSTSGLDEVIEENILSDEDPQPVSDTAAAGTNELASRDDHVHVGMKVFAQNDEPAAADMCQGDVWIDTTTLYQSNYYRTYMKMNESDETNILVDFVMLEASA